MEVDYVWETSSNNVPVQKLEQHFREKFESCRPEYYVKVPGRVNLIGEHVDYCGYSVFPMAIDQCIVVAAKRTNQRIVQLTNLSSERYESVSHDISDISAELLGKSPCWSNYFLCGVLGAREYLKENQLKAVEKIGFLFGVTGNIPESSGLSSSSALVTAAVMATLVGYGVRISRLELAEISAKCERYIGTAGGGMDQAIAVNAKQGFAARIDFNPLAVQPFRLPADTKFIVAQSLAVKNKAASNDFNTRVVECRLASQIIAKKSGLSEWERTTVLAVLQRQLVNTLDQMIELVHKYLRVDGYSKKEVCEIFSVSENELNTLSLTPNTIHVDSFFPHQRALHVFEEAKRMEKFCELCENRGSATELGRLMDESHSSLRDLYQCSHPDLDELIDLCKRGGAYGCKLTGAGWGGCVVVMVPSEGADEFVRFVTDRFYAKRSTEGKSINQLIFATDPSEGACMYVTPSEGFETTSDLPNLVNL